MPEIAKDGQHYVWCATKYVDFSGDSGAGANAIGYHGDEHEDQRLLLSRGQRIDPQKVKNAPHIFRHT